MIAKSAYSRNRNSAWDNGTPGRNRTYDTLLRTEVLYPLSYRGVGGFLRPHKKLVVFGVHDLVVAEVVIVRWFAGKP